MTTLLFLINALLNDCPYPVVYRIEVWSVGRLHIWCEVRGLVSQPLDALVMHWKVSHQPSLRLPTVHLVRSIINIVNMDGSRVGRGGTGSYIFRLDMMVKGCHHSGRILVLTTSSDNHKRWGARPPVVNHVAWCRFRIKTTDWYFSYKMKKKSRNITVITKFNGKLQQNDRNSGVLGCAHRNWWGGEDLWK